MKMENPLVRRAAKTQRDVFQLLDERAVHEHVDERQKLVRDIRPPTTGSEKVALVDTARVAPDRLARHFRSDATKKRDERTLVSRLHRIAAEKSQPGNPRMVEFGENQILRCTGERPPSREVPRRCIETPLAVMRATRNEKRHAYAVAVRDVARQDFAVIHVADALCPDSRPQTDCETCRTRSLISCVRP